MWKSLDAAGATSSAGSTPTSATSAPHFVTGLLGPLLTDPEIAFVKGFYRRPLHGEPHGGGRVTELIARPLLSTLFPQLARFVQPLSGEYAGRRDVLETLPFVEGWGVEFGLLVDVVERIGLGATAQVDLGVREHRNRPLDELGPQATAILVTALRRAGLTTAAGEGAALARFTDTFEPEHVPVEVRERPPIARSPRTARSSAASSPRNRRSGCAKRGHYDRERHSRRRPCGEARDAQRPRARRPASTAASSTRVAARANASPACQTRSVSASTCTSPSTLASSRRRVGDLAHDHRAVRDAGVGRPLEHAADDLAVEARDVELALAGDDELGAVERGLEPGDAWRPRRSRARAARRSRRAHRRDRRPRRHPRASCTSTPVRCR